MDQNKRKNTSNFIVSTLIGLIIISFLFTGYQTLQGNPDSIAKVGDYNISIREYQRYYEQQRSWYTQIFKTTDLPKSQLDNIKQSTFSSLVNSKLSLNLADFLGVKIGDEEIKDSIRQEEFFKTNNKFDVSKYRLALANAGIQANAFEEQTLERLKAQSIPKLYEDFPISDGYLKDLKSIQDNKKTVQVLKIDTSKLNQFITVTNEEIEKYLSDSNNKKRVSSVFETKKNSLSQPAQVQARHILFKAPSSAQADLEKVKLKAESILKQANSKNFASLANKHTEDPSGKGKGGDLGWFGKGRMVPEFEKVAFSLKVGEISKPVKTQFGYHLIYVQGKKEEKIAKLEDHQQEIAKDLVARSKTDQLKELETKIISEAKNLMAEKDLKNLKLLANRYKLELLSNRTINPIDDFSRLGLDSKAISKVFYSEQDEDILENKNGSTISLVKVTSQKNIPKNSKKANKKSQEMGGMDNKAMKDKLPNFDQLRSQEVSKFSKELNKATLDQVQNKVKVKRNSNIIL